MRRQYGALLILIFLVATSSAGSVDFVDLPQKCFSANKYPCSLRSNKGSLKFEKGSTSFSLGDNSAMKFVSENQFQLLQGLLWVEKASHQELVLGPELKMSFAGQILIEKQKDGSTLVRNLEGQTHFESQYIFKDEALPTGFQNWYGFVNTQKQIQRGAIRPIEITPFLKSWFAVANLPAAESRQHILSYKEAWSGAIDASTEMYREVVERRMASQVELDQTRAHNLKSTQDEKARIRQLYRQKTGFTDQAQ